MNIYTPIIWGVQFFLAFFTPLVHCLQCFRCQSSHYTVDGCKSPSLINCPSDTLCSIQTTWSGHLYGEMTVIKSCSTIDSCPSGDIQSTSACYPSDTNVTCVACCNSNGCNNGSIEDLPRPPPQPPVPQMLIDRLTHNCGNNEKDEVCETSLVWSESSERINISKKCVYKNHVAEPQDGVVMYSVENACNLDSTKEYCVSCCDLAKPCNSAATTNLIKQPATMQITITIVTYLIHRLIADSCR